MERPNQYRQIFYKVFASNNFSCRKKGNLNDISSVDIMISADCFPAEVVVETLNLRPIDRSSRLVSWSER